MEIPRVDVTLLREGLNTIRALCKQFLDAEDAEDAQTTIILIEEICRKTLWKVDEAGDAGFQ